MYFRAEQEIARDVEQVWAAFHDRSLMAHWQRTLRAITPLSGAAGETGAVTRLTYREAGRDVDMIETLVVSDRPRRVMSTLVSSMAHSTLDNRFTQMGDGGTRWSVACDLRFRGVWRLLALFGRRMIVRKTVDDMVRFARLVESPSTTSAAPP